MGAALVRTLQDIHGAGLVHRDLKPSNIVLTSRGPRVIDFGIARPEHGLTLTTTGQTVATPGYAAPEQVLGQRTGPAGDVFSLGVVLAYAAGGRPVYEGGHVAAVQYQVVHGDPELGSVPGALRPLVEPCLSKDPRGRPGLDWIGQALAPPRGADRAWKSGSLAQDIARREADARRMAALPGDRTGPSRRRLIGTLAAGGTVLVAGGGGVAWWLLRGDEAEAGGRPWEAEPLSRYDEGTAPQPLWGPVRVAETSGTALPAPLPVHDLVVVATPTGALRAYDVRSGERRWTSERTAAVTARVLAASDDVILTVGTKGALLALGTKDGRKRWSAARADVAVLLGADESAAYLATRGGGIRAVDLTSHSTLWTVPAPVSTSAKAPAEAAVAEGRLVIHGSDGRVAALDTRTGRTAWGPRQQGATSALTPAVADGVVYLGGKSLRALALASGGEKWARAGQGGSGWSAPAVRKGVVYAVDGSDLSARRADDGAEMWTLPFAADDRPLDAPVAEGGSVWAAVDMRGDQGVVAVDVRSGSIAWPYAPGAEGGWRLAAAGNRVFALQSGTLTAMPVF